MSIRRHQSFISKIILIVMMFASMAPTVSHALASMTGNRAFLQKICTSNGDKVVIQVKTTMGKQLTTEFSLKPAFDRTADSQNSGNHFEHCPFCMSHASAVFPTTYNPTLVVIDEGRFYLQSHYLAPVLTALHQNDHPSRAPPL